MKLTLCQNNKKLTKIIVSVLEMLHCDDHLQSYAILDPIETEVLDLYKIYNNNLCHPVHMPDGFRHTIYYDL